MIWRIIASDARGGGCSVFVTLDEGDVTDAITAAFETEPKLKTMKLEWANRVDANGEILGLPIPLNDGWTKKVGS